MPETVRLYEVVYIIAPDRSDEQIQATIDKYANLITSRGGVVEKTDIWERRHLAYEIKGYTEGLYVNTNFRGIPSIESELRRVFRISEDTLRFIIVKPGDETDLLSRPSESALSHTPAPVPPVEAALEELPAAIVIEAPDTDAPAEQEAESELADAPVEEPVA
jgi:small subunit ribosomal protein S6